ncbi:MAG: CaiB/BaiF CoA-transferase family protein [Actinomycetota bacterium]|nr:CaiB/BaiF CoA-transferase family protein [Actinomycetota bacterium]
MSATARTTGLLDGLRVIDLSLWQPGQVATQLLADLGADVLKAEPPGGDRMRPQIDRFVNWNGHKRSEVFHLKQPDDRARLLALVAQAEVVVEGFRPGVADRLGIGFEALRAANPAIVVCSITGFGQAGPLANVAGHDYNYQAYAGAFTFHGEHPPAHAGMLAGDMGSGLAAAFAILAAVLCARRTGEGEHIDVAITDLLAAWVVPAGPIDEDGGTTAPSDRLPGMGCYRTRDGKWVELGVYSEDNLWDQMCHGLGLGRYAGLTMVQRGEQATALRAALTQTIRSHDRDDLVALMLPLGVPVAPVLSREEMLAHPNSWERGVLLRDAEGRRRAGHPIRYAMHPVLPPGNPPALDAHHGEGFTVLGEGGGRSLL